MKIVSLSAVVALLAASLATAPAYAKHYSATDFHPGECVSIGGWAGKVIELPADHPGYIRAQSMRRGKPGGIALYLPGQLEEADCEQDLVHDISCPAVPPDNASGVAADAREAIRRNEDTIFSGASVAFQSVRLGQVRALSYDETQMYPQAEAQNGIVTVSASFVSCRADAAYVTQIERQQAYACFVNADDGSMECDSTKQLADDRIISQQGRQGADAD